MLGKSPAVGLGESVTRHAAPAKLEQAATEYTQDGSVYRMPDFNEWGSEPVLRDQMSREGLWKYGSLKAATYDLSDDTQLASYNRLLSGTSPRTAPSVVIVGDPETKFFEGKFFVLVHYYDVLYRKLIKK